METDCAALDRTSAEAERISAVRRTGARASGDDATKRFVECEKNEEMEPEGNTRDFKR